MSDTDKPTPDELQNVRRVVLALSNDFLRRKFAIKTPEFIKNSDKFDPASSWKYYNEFISAAMKTEKDDEVWDGLLYEFCERYALFFEDKSDDRSEDQEYVRVSSVPHRGGLQLKDHYNEIWSGLLPQRVEENLHLASAALGRAQDARLKRAESASRAAVLALEVKEFVDADRIRRQQIRSGVDVFPFIEAAHELAIARDARKRAAEDEEKTVQTWNKLIDEGKIIAAPKRAALAGAWTEKHGFGPKIEVEPHGMANRGHHLAEAAEDQAHFSASLTYHSLEREADAARAAAYRETQRITILLDRAVLSARNIVTARERHEANVIAAKMKIRASIERHGALNFAEQEERAYDAQIHHLSEALIYIAACAWGLHIVFGYSGDSHGPGATLSPHIISALPTWPDNIQEIFLSEAKILNPVLYETLPEQPDADQILFDVLKWTDQAAAWLVSRQQSELRSSAAISLRTLLGESEWIFGAEIPVDADGITKTPWYEFYIAGHVLPVRDHHLRLLGLSVEIEAREASTGYWRVDLIPPRWTSPRGNRDLASRDVPKDAFMQEREISFGRVTERSDERGTPAFDASQVVNIDPRGYWHIRVSGPSTKGFETSVITDVILHMALAGRHLTESF